MKKFIATITVASLSMGLFASAFSDACKAANKEEKARKFQTAVTSYLAAADVADKPTDKANAYFRAGECMRQIPGKRLKAIEYFKKELELDGASSSQKSGAQLRIGQCYYWNGKNAEAIVELKKVQSIPGAHPHHIADSLNHIGLANMKLKKYDAAVAAFKKALAVPKVHRNNISVAQLGLGHCAREQKNYDEAIAEYQKVVDIPKVYPYHASDALRYIGICYYKQKKVSGGDQSL